jgi:hypothetical protein
MTVADLLVILEACPPTARVVIVLDDAGLWLVTGEDVDGAPVVAIWPMGEPASAPPEPSHSVADRTAAARLALRDEREQDLREIRAWDMPADVREAVGAFVAARASWLAAGGLTSPASIAKEPAVNDAAYAVFLAVGRVRLPPSCWMRRLARARRGDLPDLASLLADALTPITPRDAP